MTQSRPISRRSALCRTGAAIGVLTPFWPASRLHAQPTVTKTDAKHQTHPNGQQRCQICLQFMPPHSCKLVQGEINPHGWCQFFAARENAR